MSTYSSRIRSGLAGIELGAPVRAFLNRLRLPRRSLFGFITLGALAAFEIFNYGTTEFALTDLLGDLRFIGLRWATILALAFCSMDFAGIARLFTPGRGDEKPIEVWYLMGAWFLAATMNAMLTWWSITLALLHHQGLGNELFGREALLRTVPLFVAILVWLIRVLLIGTFTLTGEALFTHAATATSHPEPGEIRSHPARVTRATAKTSQQRLHRPAPKATSRREGSSQPTSMAAMPPRRH